MSGDEPFRVAIVGGGLGGVTLGIALSKYNIPFTLYEARGSLSELGVGIGLHPAGMRALGLIDPSLAEKVLESGWRSPPPDEDIWMHLRYGAPTDTHADGESIVEIRAPPTGNLSMLRRDLLKLLADQMDVRHARFNKKLVGYEQSDDQVTLKFADGTAEAASVLIACDGVHSQVRALMFGADKVVSKPSFMQDGAYRAVAPMEKVVELIGEVAARQSTLNLGPAGYLIHYPCERGAAVNIGAWTRRETLEGEAWVVPDQGRQFQHDFKDWGERAQKLLSLFPADVAFWAAHAHKHQPDTFHDGRVLLIGDGAHTMLPHQGSGASVAAEDAYVLGQVLALVHQQGHSREAVEAAWMAVEEVREPRFSTVMRYSTEAGPRWYDFWEQYRHGESPAAWIKTTTERVKWIFDIDLAGEAEKAKHRFRELISGVEGGR